MIYLTFAILAPYCSLPRLAVLPSKVIHLIMDNILYNRF